MRASARRTARLAVAAGALVLFLASGTAAHAQDDPYGSTTTTTRHGKGGEGPHPSCRLRDTTVAPGDPDTARLRAVPRNSTVEIRFDGEVVAADVATGPGSSSQVNVDIDFVVPADAESGDHEVTAVGAEFTVSCGTLTVPSVGVLGETLTRDDSHDSGHFGALPKTGVYITLLLVIAVALLIVGRAVREASRRRARAERRKHRQRVSSQR